MPIGEEEDAARRAQAKNGAHGRALAWLCVIAALGGVLVGLVGGAFRWCIQRADELRVALFSLAHENPLWGWAIAIGVTAAGAALAALLVRWVPAAGGSGIQYVEAVERGEAPPSAPAVLAAKFMGGVLSIGSGLVLGREGPTVHMGAVVGAEIARLTHRPDDQVRTMHSALSGAGLAVAFNAPLGGTLFVLEEVARSFRVGIVLPAATGVATATATAWLIVGNAPIYQVDPVATPDLAFVGIFALFGLATGVLGAAYNRLVIGSLALATRLSAVPPVARAAVIGAAVGALLLLDPLDAGGGDMVSQRLLGGDSLLPLVIVTTLVIRFLAGPLSYAAGTPGGLFAPLLALGALWGALWAEVARALVPTLSTDILVVFVLVGMTSMFAATVRAPLTGIVIVIEMTTIATAVVPMLVGAVCAILTAAALRTAPVYEDLRERMLHPGSGGR